MRSVRSHSCPQSFVKGIVVNGRRLQWLQLACKVALARAIVWREAGGRISGERRTTRAGRRRPTGDRHCLAIRRARGGWQCQAVPHGRPTRRDRGTDRRDRGTDRWTAVTAVPP